MESHWRCCSVVDLNMGTRGWQTEDHARALSSRGWKNMAADARVVEGRRCHPAGIYHTFSISLSLSLSLALPFPLSLPVCPSLCLPPPLPHMCFSSTLLPNPDLMASDGSFLPPLSPRTSLRLHGRAESLPSSPRSLLKVARLSFCFDWVGEGSALPWLFLIIAQTEKNKKQNTAPADIGGHYK